MDENFNKLLQRTTQIKQKLLGDPWEIIPIKNKKYARECEEIHLGGRGIEGLKNFSDFPNIEVLWINNNKMTLIEGLDDNFRIKHLYAHDNKIQSLEGSLQYMKHIETLLLYNNELRGLDQNINFLKEFTHISQLDLFDNPLAEEPNYKWKVIYNMPQLRIFDRHMITIQDRRKAKEWFIKDQEVNQGRFKRQRSKHQKQKGDSKNLNNFTKKLPPSAIFSKGELDLYKEAQKIRERQQQEKQEQERIEKEEILARTTQKLNQTLPQPKIVWETKSYSGLEQFSFLTEWDKNKIKPLFKAFDKNKKASIENENLLNLFQDLIEDKNFLGKVPNCSEEEFLNAFKEESGIVSWTDFRQKLNDIPWKRTNQEILEERINQKYYEGNKLKNSGKPQQSFQQFHQALRLESILEQNDKEFTLVPKKKEQPILRMDYMDYDAYKFKKTFQETGKLYF